MTAATAARGADDVAAGPHPGAGDGHVVPRSGLASEERLLLLSAGGPGNDAAMRDVILGGVNWGRFLGLAQLERAVPVIYPRLRALAADSAPADALDQLRRLALVSDFAMLHLESRLRESLEAFASARIPVMLLKGAALAHSVYAGVRQRPMSDIDVLVDPANGRSALRVMLAAGWREIVGGIPEVVYERHHHLPPLRDARSAELQLEIHTALFPERQPFAFDARDVWENPTPLEAFPGVFVPTAAHSLLHACLHFFWSHQGRFGVWRTVRDVDAILRSGRLDWARFAATARAARGATSCYWTLRIAKATAGVAVPTEVLDELRPRRSSYLLNALERHFLINLFPAQVACPSVTLDHMLWELAVMPRQSGHGAIRPWDADEEFVVPSAAHGHGGATPGGRRVRRLLASPSYIRTLLRSLG